MSAVLPFGRARRRQGGTNDGTVWTDYAGDSAYGDFTVSGSGKTQSRTDINSYEPGAWRKLGSASSYLHSDQLGTLRRTTGTTGTAPESDTFTAFGERVAGSPDRHGYVGAFGYQSTLDAGAEVFPFQHLGHRYYDPASGRFLQRDPIGIRGGTNVFAYVSNSPTVSIDPNGAFGWIIGGIIGGIVGGISEGLSGGNIVAGVIGGAVTGGLIGAGVPSTVASAAGGAITGGLSGYANGKGVGGSLVDAGIGATTGVVSGFIGGHIGDAADLARIPLKKDTEAVVDISLSVGLNALTNLVNAPGTVSGGRRRVIPTSALGCSP